MPTGRILESSTARVNRARQTQDPGSARQNVTRARYASVSSGQAVQTQRLALGIDLSQRPRFQRQQLDQLR